MNDNSHTLKGKYQVENKVIHLPTKIFPKQNQNKANIFKWQNMQYG